MARANDDAVYEVAEGRWSYDGAEETFPSRQAAFTALERSEGEAGDGEDPTGGDAASSVEALDRRIEKFEHRPKTIRKP